MKELSLKEKSMQINRCNPFVQLLGTEILDVEPGFSRMRLAVRPELLNPHGLVHGGALFSLADNAAGCAASTDGRTYVTQSGDIHFLRALSSGAVVAEAQTRHRGKSTVLVEVSLSGEDGKLLATASFTLFCVDGSEIERNSPAVASRS